MSSRIRSQARTTAQEQARQELAHRELCRRRLMEFIKRFKADYKAGNVHLLIAAKLEKFLDDVINERSPRLIIQMPPRLGKSEIISDKFPSWALGKYPHLEVIASSYAASLAVGFSKVIRSRFSDPDYQRLFPDAILDKEEQGAEIWRTTQRGGYQAAGVGGPIVGRGANILIIDDPIKNYEEANSPVIRESVWDWYRSSARTRLSPGGGVLLIMQRWHDADLAGRMINEPRLLREAQVPEDEIEDFEVISFPGIAEHDEYVKDLKVYDHPVEGGKLFRREGEALHEDRYPIAYLRRTRRTMGERMFSALYQQNPVPDSGDFFSRDDFRWVDELPTYYGERPIYITADLAIGRKQANDYTVIGAAMYDEFRRLTILEVIRGRFRTMEIINAIVELGLRYRHNLRKIGIEHGQLSLAIRDALLETMSKRRLNVYLDEELKPISDKRMRAGPLQSWMQQGRILFPKNQNWATTVESELLRFDAGEHDDCVDMLAWMVRMVQNEPVYDPDKQRVRRDGKTVEDRIRETLAAQRLSGGSLRHPSDTGFMQS